MIFSHNIRKVTDTLASSINIGTAVYDIIKGEVSANIGNMPLNCLVFQDDIAKMNWTLEDIGRMLESKQLKTNVSVQICSDWVAQMEERMPKKNRK